MSAIYGHRLDALPTLVWERLRRDVVMVGNMEADDRAGLRSAEITRALPDGFKALFLGNARALLEPFAPGLELQDLQVTLTRDGGFFAEHQDARFPGVEGRIVSFVYYLGDHDSFKGGLLRFATGETVGPVDNSLVVFDGLVEHQVTRVRGEGAVRLTVNGYYGEKP